LTALSHLSKLPCGIRLNANPILLRRGALGTSRSYVKQKSHRNGWDFKEEGYSPAAKIDGFAAFEQAPLRHSP
jgi:hypothetical protein